MWCSNSTWSVNKAPESPYRDIPDITFCARGIQKQLESIRSDKACGPDQIRARVFKESAFELAPIFASLFQQLFIDGVLPSARKDAADPKNDRPVSLTSLITKTMEHIIFKQICSHLSGNSVNFLHQHGFQREFSCETQLITVIHEWASILNIHGQVDVIFLDFAKAFETVPHERLLLKANFYGISEKLAPGFSHW